MMEESRSTRSISEEELEALEKMRVTLSARIADTDKRITELEELKKTKVNLLVEMPNFGTGLDGHILHKPSSIQIRRIDQTGQDGLDSFTSSDQSRLPTPRPSAPDPAEVLLKLSKLKSEGVISEQEFFRLKQKITQEVIERLD